jgi:hypothetical protein
MKDTRQMTNLRLLSFILILFIAASLSVAQAQNWPCWRGPNGDGTTTETNLPVKWDSITNVIWKIRVPGTGYSSPIVWKDKIFMTTAFPETWRKFCFAMIPKAAICYGEKPCSGPRSKISTITTVLLQVHPQPTVYGFMCLSWTVSLLWYVRMTFQENRSGCSDPVHS